MYPSTRFKRNLLSSCIAALALTNVGALQAQDATDADEIVVTGVRAAQEKAIDIKRNTVEIVDSVAAEDIGKLPDVTIADSLQRITGIQISRNGGQEGGLVSVRGSDTVLSTLNGETFLTAKSLTENKADFTDIPSSLVSGITVYKSQSASNIEGGVSASIDMITKRALKLDDGLTLTGNIKGSRGNISKSNDLDASGYFGWKTDDKIATSLALSYSDATLSDNRGVNDSDLAVESSWGCPSAGCQDINGNGKTGDEIINSASWDSRAESRLTERERLGLNYNFNMQINDAFELNANVMYNKMTEKTAGQFLYFTNGTDRSVFHDYAKATGTAPFPASGLHDATLPGKDKGRTAYATELNTFVSGLRAGVMGDYRDTDAINTDLELKFDNGGAFTGSTRWVHGNADSTNNTLTVAGVTYTKDVPRTLGGPALPTNPTAINNGTIYPVNLRSLNDHFEFSVDQKLADLASKPSAWAIHFGWVDGGHQEADSDVLRADGNFKFADQGLTSVDFGLRFSDRSTTNDSFSFFSPSGYIENGVELLNKYHESGYAIGGAGKAYDPLPVFNFSDSKLKDYITTVNDFGKAVSGVNLNIPIINVDKIDDPVAFENMLYGKGEQILNPDRSYVVDEKKQSVNVKFNFEAPISDNVTMTGNAGLRYVKTDITVISNIADSTKLNPKILAGTDPNHTTMIDQGDKVTDISRNKALPSINTTFSFGDEWKLKAAFSETTATQNLSQLGEGSITYYQGAKAPETFSRINSVNNNGNPNLEPWSADLFSVSVEWYPSDTALVSVGYFHMDIASFVTKTQVLDPTLKDSDGVARLGANVNTVKNGKGGMIQGMEYAYQQSFTSLPGILANTGITFNYTYSPSKGDASQKLTNGDSAPMGKTAKNQGNLILWYQDDKLQARIAANYLDKQYEERDSGWYYNADHGVDSWIKPQLFLDMSGSYDITEKTQISLAISNILGEDKIKYSQWENNITQYDLYERRVTLGVNAKF